MNSSFVVKSAFSLLLLVIVPFIFQSCSEDETTPDPAAGLIKISEGYALGAAARVEVWAQEELFAGYNKLFIALYDSVSGKRITDSHVHFHPEMDMGTMSHSCPVEDPRELAVNMLFPGGVMFTMPSGDMGSWSLEISVHNHLNGLRGSAMFAIDVAPATHSKIVSFQASNNKRYYLSYRFENKMKVGVNPFEVIAYTIVNDEFVPAEDLTIILTPEMPSMDHGSPNNENPAHVYSGHYSGKVNFTMTGEWRLNLSLMDGDDELGIKYFDVLVE